MNNNRGRDVIRRGYPAAPLGKMPRMNEPHTNRKDRRTVAAPPPSNPRLRSHVLSVECALDQEVEWQWTETLEGSLVTGYRLVPRPAVVRSA
jgi:hypothetical protein